LVEGYLDLLEGEGGPLCAGDGRVADGVRYHVLDVWVDGLVGVEGWEERVGGLMRPVVNLKVNGKTKVVRGRAKGVVEDERLRGVEDDGGGEHGDGEGEGDFEGFGK
jgi:ribosomal RNA-processing protein 1